MKKKISFFSKDNIAKTFMEAQAKGYKEGYKRAIDEVYENVFLTFQFLLLPAIYNVKDNKKLSNKYLVELEPLILNELQRLVNENIKSAIPEIAESIKSLDSTAGIETLEDKSQVLIAQVNELRKKLGAVEIGSKHTQQGSNEI